jgi:hypothetical protein
MFVITMNIIKITFRFLSFITMYNARQVSCTIFDIVRSPTLNWKDRLLKVSPRENRSHTRSSTVHWHHLHSCLLMVFVQCTIFELCSGINMIASQGGGILAGAKQFCHMLVQIKFFYVISMHNIVQWTFRGVWYDPPGNFLISSL